MSGPRARRGPPAHRQGNPSRQRTPSEPHNPVVKPNWAWLGPPARALYAAGWVVLPLRLFLGFTFCFAGLQKLANPGFFDAANPASIQAQLSGAARLSPIHALVAPLVHVAVPLGIVIALGEVAVGLGALLGLWTRVAAAGGIGLSLMLFLTVSFHSSPYYTGSDIVFVFAWTPLLLAGSGGVVSVDTLVAQVVRRRVGLGPDLIVPIEFSTVYEVCGSYDEGRCRARRGARCEPAPCPFLIGRAMSSPSGAEMDRRTFAAKGTVAAAAALTAVVGGGLAAGVGRLVGGSSSGRDAVSGGHGGTSREVTTAPTTTPSTTTVPKSAVPTTAVPTTGAVVPSTAAPRSHPPGTAIGPASVVPVGGAGSFLDPGTGDPSLVIQPRAGTFVAFDAVCPHAGCTVQYEADVKVLVCPCHGSRFNADTGAVEQGPAPTGLQSLRITEGSDGQLYVT
jgi:thiosulfate dehydrogenase [quinone] large subunit